MPINIVDFDIILSKSDTGYTARASTNALGSTNASLMPLNDPQFLGTTKLVDLFMDAPVPNDATTFALALVSLRSGFPDKDTVTMVGTGLYNALPNDVRDLYNLVWGQVRSTPSQLLRLRLHFDAPELGMLPWEYIKVGPTFLGARPQQSVIRYPEVSDPAGTLGLSDSGPLKILIWAANPGGTAALQFPDEVTHIKEELDKALGSQVQIDLVRSGGPRDLLNSLRSGYHIWHYIGHGTFEDGEGKLVFERTPGAEPSLVTAGQIMPGLLNNPTLQLVFLNSCQTAQGSATSAYASLGFNLARYAPAVIAMQYAVPDESAIIFSQDFYRALSARSPLDVCVTEGRQSLLAEYGDQRMDWGIPALFTRAITANILTDASAATLSGSLAPPANPAATDPQPTKIPTTDTSQTPDQLQTNALKRDLVTVLVSAFPSISDVKMLTDFYLGQPLERITNSSGTTDAVLLDVINWCLRQDPKGMLLAQLMAGAIRERPMRTDLIQMRDRLAAAGMIPGGTMMQSAQTNGTEQTSPPTTPSTQMPTNPPPAGPQLAVLSDDRNRIRLTPDGRRLLMNALLNAPWTQTSEGRDQLLSNLPQNLQNGISRSSNRSFDLNAIEKMAEDWGKMVGGIYDGKYALTELVRQARDLSDGSQGGAALPEAATFNQLLAYLEGLVT